MSTKVRDFLRLTCSRPALCSLIYSLLFRATPPLLFIIISLLFFGRHHQWTHNIFGVGSDPIQTTWFINWWPYSILHGLNPFISYYLWYPHGFNLVWHTSVPSPSLLGLPITLIWGPVLTYNILAITAPAFSAWTAFLLVKYITNNWPASIVGGYLFGFSSYEICQAVGHLNLSFTFIIPIVVLLCLKRVNNKIQRIPFFLFMTLSLSLQFCSSTEIFATMCTFGTITLLTFYLFSPTNQRVRILMLALDVVISLVFTAAFISPFLYYIIIGFHNVPHQINSASQFSADVLNFFVPTIMTHFGGNLFSPISNKFTGNPVEQGAYLGLPLIFLMSIYFRDHIKTTHTKILAIITIIIVVASLGPTLHVAGSRIDVTLPWAVATYLPLIRSALPVRFTMYLALISGIVAALFLTSSRGIWQFILRYSLVAFCILAILPNEKIFSWQHWPTQNLFSKHHIEANFGSRPNLLVLPFGPNSPNLALQINASMSFTQPDGYIGFVPSSESRWRFVHDNIVLSSTKTSSVVQKIRNFCLHNHVDYIVVGPGTRHKMADIAEHLGWPVHTLYGRKVIRVPFKQRSHSFHNAGD